MPLMTRTTSYGTTGYWSKAMTAHLASASCARVGSLTSPAQTPDQPPRESAHQGALWFPVQRHHQRLQRLSPRGHRWDTALSLLPLQPHRRVAAQSHHLRLFVWGGADQLGQ